MTKVLWRLGFAFAVVTSTTANAQPPLGPLPSPPAFDHTPIKTDKAEDAALTAIGSLAGEFVDHTVNSPLFIGPQDVWVGKFLTRPQLYRSGICVERMLLVPLRLAKTNDGKATWQPHHLRWVYQMRIVGRVDDSDSQPPNLKAINACNDLAAFKAEYSFGLLDAKSVNEAWSGAFTLQKLLVIAQSNAKLPFALSCQPRADLKSCRSPEHILSGLDLLQLQNVDSCQKELKPCLQMNIGIPGTQDYWRLTAILAAPGSTDVTNLAMDYIVPPSI